MTGLESMLQDQLGGKLRSSTGAITNTTCPHGHGITNYRALNLDSQSDIRKVIELYRAAYGSYFPWRRIYSELFWRSQAGNFANRHSVHLIAETNGKFIAHFGLRGDGSSYEFFLAAYDPQERYQILSVFRAGWKHILKIGKRQQWQNIFFFCLLENLTTQFAAHKIFKATPVAIIPNCIPSKLAVTLALNSSAKQACRSVMLMWLPLTGPGKSVLFPPSRHRNMLNTIYAPLRLTRHLTEQQEPLPERVVSTNPEFSCLHRSRFNINEMNIHSSSDDVSRIMQAIEGKLLSNRLQILKIKLDNPNCPEISAAVEERGFRFCGIHPSANGDSLIYSLADDLKIRNVRLYSEQARELLDYIQSCRLQ